MPLVSDIGGRSSDQPIDRSSHELSDWERKIDAIMQVLGRKKLLRGDELRRTIEQLSTEQYESMVYYEKWAYAIEHLMQEKGIISQEELERKIAELKTEGG